jgi:hypothetical protein
MFLPMVKWKNSKTRKKYYVSGRWGHPKRKRTRGKKITIRCKWTRAATLDVQFVSAPLEMSLGVFFKGYVEQQRADEIPAAWYDVGRPAEVLCRSARWRWRAGWTNVHSGKLLLLLKWDAWMDHGWMDPCQLIFPDSTTQRGYRTSYRVCLNLPAIILFFAAQWFYC